jgi:hypothetical protein
VIRASSTRADVNGANIRVISARCFSQYRAEVCHASSTFFCSSGIISDNAINSSRTHIAVLCDRQTMAQSFISHYLISDVLPFGRLWYVGPNAVRNAVGFATFYNRSHDAVIRVCDDAGNVIQTHEHAGDFKKW